MFQRTCVQKYAAWKHIFITFGQGISVVSQAKVTVGVRTHRANRQTNTVPLFDTITQVISGDLMQGHKFKIEDQKRNFKF